MSRILSQEGANPEVSQHFFKAVVQAVLMFGAETWFLTPRMERDLSIFQHRVAQCLTMSQTNSQGGGSWDYPPLVLAMVEAGFEEIGAYIVRRQNTVTQYIATRTIIDLCERSIRSLGVWLYQWWW